MEKNFIELKKPEEKLNNKAIAITIENVCHDLRDEVGGLEMVGSAHRSSNSTVGLEKSDNVPKLGLCMEVLKLNLTYTMKKTKRNASMRSVRRTITRNSWRNSEAMVTVVVTVVVTVWSQLWSNIDWLWTNYW